VSRLAGWSSTRRMLARPLGCEPGTEGVVTFQFPREAVCSRQPTSTSFAPLRPVHSKRQGDLSSTRRLVTRFGCAVMVAEDGAQALEILTHHRRKFDALVIDLEMPGLSGTALLEKLDDRGIHIPALIVSGVPDARQRAREVHAAFMSKPFDVDRLEAKVGELLEAPS